MARSSQPGTEQQSAKNLAWKFLPQRTLSFCFSISLEIRLTRELSSYNFWGCTLPVGRVSELFILAIKRACGSLNAAQLTDDFFDSLGLSFDCFSPPALLVVQLLVAQKQLGLTQKRSERIVDLMSDASDEGGGGRQFGF